MCIRDRLWQDLIRAQDEVTSPAWHEAALRETETKYNQGEESTLDWEQAKAKLHKKMNLRILDSGYADL